MMKVISYAALLLLPLSAFAGGDAWRFHVDSVADSNGGAQEISLRVLDSSPSFAPECNSISVIASYDWNWWQRSKPMRNEDHEQAILTLRHASTSRSPILFGVMGQGVFSKGDQPCTFISRGLQVLEGAVYSFYKWP